MQVSIYTSVLDTINMKSNVGERRKEKLKYKVISRFFNGYQYGFLDQFHINQSKFNKFSIKIQP